MKAFALYITSEGGFGYCFFAEWVPHIVTFCYLFESNIARKFVYKFDFNEHVAENLYKQQVLSIKICIERLIQVVNLS